MALANSSVNSHVSYQKRGLTEEEIDGDGNIRKTLRSNRVVVSSRYVPGERRKQKVIVWQVNVVGSEGAKR